MAIGMDHLLSGQAGPPREPESVPSAGPPAPGPVDDTEQPVIDEVAPGLEDLGVFA
jgi:hypothetical protein